MEEIGRMVIDMMTTAGYYVIAAVVIKDILSSISKRDMEGIIKAGLSGVVGLAAILMVERLLDKVKDVMK